MPPSKTIRKSTPRHTRETMQNPVEEPQADANEVLGTAQPLALSNRLAASQDTPNLYNVRMREMLFYQLGTNGFTALSSPYGLSRFGENTRSIDLHLQPDSEVQIAALDAQTAVSYAPMANTWFGDDAPNLEHHRLIKTDPDGRRFVTLKLVLAGDDPTEILDLHRKPTSIDDLNAGCKVMVMAQVNKMWLTNEKFGVTLYAKRVIVKKGTPPTRDFVLDEGWQNGW